jgi:hypothetical protein
MRLILAPLAFLVVMPAGCALVTVAQGGQIEACLPPGVSLDTSFSPDGGLHRRVRTVREQLVLLGAHCQGGKLRDRWGNEIFFCRVPEFGNPPMDYNEIQSRAADELKEHEKKGRLLRCTGFSHPYDGPRARLARCLSGTSWPFMATAGRCRLRRCLPPASK